MNSGDCLSNCPRGRGKNNKQHRKLSFSTAKKSGNCIYFWCLVPQINPGALEKTWYVFNIPIIYNTQRCIVAAARVSLFHPQTKTNYEDEFPEDELPPEDEFLFEDGFRRRITRRRTPRRRILKTNFPEYEFWRRIHRRRKLPPEDEFLFEDGFRRRIPRRRTPRRRILKTNFPEYELLPEDEFWRRILKTNSPKTKIAPRRRIPCRRRMAPEDEFFPEDQTRQRSVAFENVRWGCPGRVSDVSASSWQDMAGTMRGAKASSTASLAVRTLYCALIAWHPYKRQSAPCLPLPHSKKTALSKEVSNRHPDSWNITDI